MHREGNFEKYVGYLGPKCNKKPKRFSGLVNCPQVGKFRCDTVTGRTSCLAPNTEATEIENIEDIFYLYFDDKIMN